MRRKQWGLYLWPGLPQLWLRGSWPALGVALAAAALLNLAVWGSFGFSELMAPAWRRAVWLALGAVWLGAGVVSIVDSRRRTPGEAKDAFELALEQYLKGDWFQAERLLADLLRSNADDPDARLMLATLFRHTGRLDEAASQLDLLARLDGAEKWQWELRRERELLSRAGPHVDDQKEGQREARHHTADPTTDVTHADCTTES